MFTLHNLQLRQMVAKASPVATLSDAEEDHKARNDRIAEQARGNLPMDPVRDLPKMEDAALQGAKSVESMIDTFNPGQENPKKIASKLSNCDGVAVPQASPVWKNVFRPVIRSLPVSKAEPESGGEVWRTISGRRVQIKEGESVKEAYDRDVKEQGGQRGAGRPEERGARVAQGKKFATISPRGRVLIHQAEAMLKERGVTRERFMTKVDGQFQELHRMKDKYGVERVLTGKEVTKFLSKETDSLKGIGKEPSQEKSSAVQFVSSNKKQGLTQQEAVSNLDSERQQWLMELHSDVDAFCGLKSEPLKTIGEWNDPQVGRDIENSSVDLIENSPDYETVKYGAALKGLHSEQLGVVAFREREGGEKTLYTIHVPHEVASGDWNSDVQKIGQVLDAAGLKYRTFVKSEQGTSVMVYDDDGSARDSIAKAAKFMEAKVDSASGDGELIMKGTREEAAAEYKKIISAYESKSGKSYQLKREPPIQKALIAKSILTILRECGVLHAKHNNPKGVMKDDR